MRTSLNVQPHLYIGDVTGRPLDYGMVFLGEKNKDPELYPIDIFYDEALTIPATQPVRTKGGFLNANGDICEIFAKELTYSVKVLDQYKRKVFYKRDMSRTNTDENITSILPFPNAVPRPLAKKNADSVSVKDFGAKGDGNTNDTQAILNAIAYVNTSKQRLYFPAGRYWFDGGAVLGDGVVIYGDGRNSSVIISRLSIPTGESLFNCAGYGSGIEKLRFIASPAQTSGSYVVLSGAESFINDFFMDGDYNGVLMTGNVSRIRHGRFQDGAKNAIRIRAEGGDNSQIIDDVLMGAQTPFNTCYAGIRVRNSSALMISNTSVITMGYGLLIDPQSSDENVFSLYASNCFFDNCKTGIAILPANTGGVYRCRFANCWASSATQDGVRLAGNAIEGAHFESCHLVLNTGSGMTTGAGCKDIAVIGGEICQNKFGFYIDANIDKLKILNATIGSGAGLAGNGDYGIFINTINLSNSIICNNVMTGNGIGAIYNISKNQIAAINNNIGAYESIGFTPKIVIDGVDADASYSVQNGSYILRGSQIDVDFQIILSNKGSKTGLVGIALPKNAVLNSNGKNITGTITNISNMTGLTGAVLITNNSNSYCSLTMTNSNGLANLTTANLTNTSAIYGRLTYYIQ